MARLTYPNYPARCGWNVMLPPRQARPALEGPMSVPYAVIGAGYTGIAAAWRLAELAPGAEIALLEASVVGEGSSARNSGFLGRRVMPKEPGDRAAERARIQSRFQAEGFDWLEERIRTCGIGCNLTRAGYIRAAATEQGQAVVRAALEVARSNALGHELLSRADLERRIGTAYYGMGLYLEDSYLLQPAALVRGLADALPSQVILYENTPVLSLRRDGKWRIETPGGIVLADTIVLATNGFITRFGYLKSRLVTIYTYAAVTEALPDADRQWAGEDTDWGVLPSHRLGTTLRRVGADRLMVRSLYAYEGELETTQVTRALRQRFERRWPALSHVPFDYVWGGTTALTMNGSPWWGRIDENAYASGGCNGGGIVKGVLLGKYLAQLIAGQGDPGELIGSLGLANWIAPEPFRTVGFHVASAYGQRKAGMEM
ncbi:FAD-binding oxidoreductase [Labrys sp. LIt4]|uniref:NAD(P)/FAD-dependent oxidoreductase n=1 Tax=Labrys sp. LIt4 TaxID=2821355 RepID=UPI001ADF0F99|nr:FAD-dependent oxidoreductase [Labrys sp. LIt4]MBP0583299.1 FAD-binding oxidoreductase [Labrys sp. LIt4]